MTEKKKGYPGDVNGVLGHVTDSAFVIFCGCRTSGMFTEESPVDRGLIYTGKWMSTDGLEKVGDHWEAWTGSFSAYGPGVGPSKKLVQRTMHVYV